MGSPLGPTFANYYMCELENKVLPIVNNRPKVYCRFADDIFLLVNSELEISELKEAFEKESVLKFTIEMEKDR